MGVRNLVLQMVSADRHYLDRLARNDVYGSYQERARRDQQQALTITASFAEGQSGVFR